MAVQPEHGKGAGGWSEIVSMDVEWMEREEPKPLCFRTAAGAAAPQPRGYSLRSRSAVSTRDSSAACGQHRAQLPLPPHRCTPASFPPSQGMPPQSPQYPSASHSLRQLPAP